MILAIASMVEFMRLERFDREGLTRGFDQEGSIHIHSGFVDPSSCPEISGLAGLAYLRTPIFLQKYRLVHLRAFVVHRFEQGIQER